MIDDYDKYAAKLRVNKHRLDDELEEQPDIMGRISNKVAALSYAVNQSKDDLARTEARLGEHYRETDAKITVAGVDAKVRRDPDRAAAWQVYQNELQEFGRWKGLLAAWKQRGYSMKTLSDLYAANYFSVDSHRAPDSYDNDRGQIARLRRGLNTALDEAKVAPRRREQL